METGRKVGRKRDKEKEIRLSVCINAHITGTPIYIYVAHVVIKVFRRIFNDAQEFHSNKVPPSTLLPRAMK